MRRSPFRVASAVVALALAASAHGDSLSSYKKQVAGGPAEQAIGAAIDALQAGDLKKAEVASLKALTLAPDEPHALALSGNATRAPGKCAEISAGGSSKESQKRGGRRSDGAVPGRFPELDDAKSRLAGKGVS